MARKAKEKAVAKLRDPTEKEAAAILVAKENRKARPVRVSMKFSDKSPGILHADPPHSDANGTSHMLSDALGTTADDFVTDVLLKLANGTRGKDAPTNGISVNASLALISAIAPRDELEAALATNMAVTHDLSLEMLRRARHSDYPDNIRVYGNLATKLSRTFTAQLKQLADWRRGGEQVVRHIHVQSGGQAVVAETINVGGRENENIGDRSHALGPTLLGQNAEGHALPVARDPRTEAVPDAQWASEGDTGQ